MKNIHVLPTDKSSRLQKNRHNKLFLSEESKFYSDCINQYIYITSDEEIKQGDWVYSEQYKNILQFKLPSNKYFYKKINLTTDQDLIKDGVQAIDDEFLEWFVQHPSCEEVTIDFSLVSGSFKYKIIIPKDYSKIKEGLEKSIKGKEHFVQHFKSGGTVEDFKPTEENCTCTDECLGYLTKTCKKVEEEPKQETLEEDLINSSPQEVKALIRHYKGLYLNYKSIVDRQERSYSEEDMREAFIAGGNSQIEEDDAYGNDYLEYMEDWFEQFKKK